MNIEEAVERACREPTLVKALSSMCLWESERAIDQARSRFGSVTNDADWDTCFEFCINRVIEKYNTNNI